MDKIKYLLTDDEIWQDGFEAGYKEGECFVLSQIANEEDIKEIFKKYEREDTEPTDIENTD